MSATGDSTPTDRILEAVTAWSLKRHHGATRLHAWTLTAARAIVAGTPVPEWTGESPTVGECYLARLRRLIAELGGPPFVTPRICEGPAGTVPA